MNKMRESFESSSIFTQYYSDEHEFSGDMYQNSFLQSDYIKFCEGYQAALASQAQQESLQIGDMRENGVNWYGKNPHAFPVGTKFIAIPPEGGDK